MYSMCVCVMYSMCVCVMYGVCVCTIHIYYHMHGLFGEHIFILAEGELVQEQTEAKNVERNISQLQHDMVKLNTLVAKKKSEQESLEQGNLLMEGDFVHALKVCTSTF